MRRFFVLLALLFVAPPLEAQLSCQTPNQSIGSCTVTGAISITIARTFQLSVSPASTVLTPPTASAYNTGSAVTAGPTIIMRSNSAWTVAISSASPEWSATNTQTEPARTNKPASDLRWALTAEVAGTPLTTTPVTVRSGAATGETAVPLFYRTAYTWNLDTPGSYSLTLVFTVTAP